MGSEARAMSAHPRIDPREPSVQLLPLLEVASQIKLGAPLAWSIRDRSGKLLLARGNQVNDAQVLQALLERGMFVDAAELRGAHGRDRQPPKEGFFGRWRLSSARLNTLLTAPHPGLGAALGEVADVLMSLAERYPDKVLFQILRHDQTRLQAYGISHSLHAAAVCCLTGKRMGWNDADRRTLVGAALSMNISMIELQGRLAVQGARPTPEQREFIAAHPRKSVEMLEVAGVGDPLWLAAVEQHHEKVDGSGYPSGRTEIAEAAQALHYVDVFTAKLSARSSRPALPPDHAARSIFTASSGHPLTAALVKEFGIYPPGCFVRLATGETAIVIHRGESVNTPVVACLTRPNGQPLMKAQRRETGNKASGVVSIVADSDVMVRVPWESLYADD
jgi:HD-GYP domain-containing protein (c-di-GMP phosphodiesterase class II)